MMEEGKGLPHKLVLDNRETLTVTGVGEVVHLDESAIVVHTELGTLVIQGRGLQLRQLTPEGGQVAVTGEMDGLFYRQHRQAAGFLKRLLG